MSETILDVKEAAKIAVAYVADLLSQDQLRDIRLEEVELSEDDDYWLVTIGFSRPEITKNVWEIVGGQLGREYRQVKLQARDGKVISMKIRNP